MWALPVQENIRGALKDPCTGSYQGQPPNPHGRFRPQILYDPASKGLPHGGNPVCVPQTTPRRIRSLLPQKMLRRTRRRTRAKTFTWGPAPKPGSTYVLRPHDEPLKNTVRASVSQVNGACIAWSVCGNDTVQLKLGMRRARGCKAAVSAATHGEAACHGTDCLSWRSRFQKGQKVVKVYGLRVFVRLLRVFGLLGDLSIGTLFVSQG